MIPREVLDAYAIASAHIEPINVGLINETHLVVLDGAPRFVLQKLHPIFEGEVCLDLEIITAQLARSGLATPELVRTSAGAPYVRVDGGVHRMITFVPGRTITQVTEPRVAFEAAALASRFHAALDGFEHVFRFTRSGVHDTAAHLARLERWLASGHAIPDHALTAPIAEAILAHARALDPLPELPRRIVHGDLKISNVRFDDTLDHAVALIDLDTLAHGTMAYELGDALRSWAQRGGESAGETAVDHEIVRAAIEGYASTGHPLTIDERASIIVGFETIATELAARFCIDAWEDAYFGWDRARFASRREHDRVRALSQLSLARSVRSSRAALEAIVQNAFSK